MDELAHLGPQVAMVLHYLHEWPLLSYELSLIIILQSKTSPNAWY